MKQAELPENIFLQWNGDSEDEELTAVAEDQVTWARERVFQRDIEYIRADLAPQWHDEKEELPPFNTPVAVYTAQGLYRYDELRQNSNGEIYWAWAGVWAHSKEPYKVVAWMPIPEYKPKEKTDTMTREQTENSVEYWKAKCERLENQIPRWKTIEKDGIPNTGNDYYVTVDRGMYVGHFEDEEYFRSYDYGYIKVNEILAYMEIFCPKPYKPNKQQQQ